MLHIYIYICQRIYETCITRSKTRKDKTNNDIEYVCIRLMICCPIQRCHVEFHAAATQREKERLGARNYGHK